MYVVYMINSKLSEIRKQVLIELEHIPKGNKYQNMLRQYYFTIRMNSLGKKAKYPNDKNKVLLKVIENLTEYLKKEQVEFNPNYDENFFSL